MTGRKGDTKPWKDKKDYIKPTKDPLRPYKAIQDHNRSLKAMLNP